MFLTRFRLNPRKRGTLHHVGSPQRLHAAVLATLPPHLAQSSSGRVLWRLDQPSSHEWNLYVVSPGRPSMEQLQDDCGWSQEPSWSTVDYRPFLENLRVGQRWVFRLAANPVRSVAGERGGRGAVRPEITVEQQHAWLVSRAAHNGFALGDDPHASVVVTRREREQFSRGHSGKRMRVSVSRAQFDGVLEVTDANALRSMLTNGVGRAKAYGCGLMTLAPTS